MKLNFDLFAKGFSFLNEMFEQKANEINRLEKEFREIKRKTLHPDWRVFRRYKRKWITFGGEFELNLTMYEVIDKLTNKSKRFVYYHHQKLKELRHSKYDIDILKLTIWFYLMESKIPLFLRELLPSKQLFNHYLKSTNIHQIIDEKNREILKKNYHELEKSNEQIYIEMDDFYINHQQKNNKKMRVREAIFHKVNKTKLDSVINLFFTKNLDEKDNEYNNLNYVFSNLKEFIKPIKNDSEIVINGDAARWIQTLAKQLNVNFSLDLFHIKRGLNLTFGTNKFASKANKKFFNKYYSKRFNSSWKDVFEYAIFSEGLDFFKENYLDFLTQAKRENAPKSIIINARNFYKMIVNNSKWLFENKQNLSSFTEHFVFNSFKKHIVKQQSLYAFDNIKTLVTFKNLLKNQATVFL
ncbi:UPF0236 family protein [Mycoplasma putrefaciens]|uniref:Mbov_0401 family ICE element transposase-like protein n=1 Tax=Mycoplasma putrefaciens TaxID=2123 RepID=UPI003DA2455B